MAFVEGVAVGLVANGLSACGVKAAQCLTSMLTRRQAMRFGIRHRLGADKLSSDLAKDLAQAFGSEGKLDIVTDSALKMVAVSNLIPHMLELANTDIEPEGTLVLLDRIYRAAGGDDDQHGGEFAQNVWHAISAFVKRTDELRQIGIKFVSTNSSRRGPTEAVRRRETALAGLSSLYPEGAAQGSQSKSADGVPIETIQSEDKQAVQLIARSIESALNEIDVHGASGDVVSVPLDKVFSEVPVRPVPPGDPFFQYRAMRFSRSTQRSVKGWAEVASTVDRTVLLGDPGGGKSTLSKKICVEIARSAQKGGLVLPLFLQLRTYAAERSVDDSFSLFDSLTSLIADVLSDWEPIAVRSFLNYMLTLGRCFIVFDGLDEVLSDGNRAAISKSIVRFADRYPLCSVLVTSRYVGYETNPLRNFNHIGVCELEEETIKEIYRNISTSVLQKDRTYSDANLSSFLKESRKKASELIKNPLLLTLIIIIHFRKREIPDNRADLYAHCAELLFDRWDGYRNITPDLPERFRLYDLLMHLASLLFESEELGGRISKPALENEARKFFRKDYVDNREGRAAHAARLLVEHLTGRAWILHEVGENIFEFTHRTFLEFFYAKHLEEKYEVADDLLPMGSRS